MDFVVVILVFALFGVGLVLAMQGFIGQEINPEGPPFALTRDPSHPGITHPPERHRGRLMLIGAGMMVLAVVLGLVAL